MKKLFSFVAAALMSASMFATPAAIPTVQDVAGAGFDVANARVIVIYFDEVVCNDVVWAGSYNEWNTEPAAMLKFEALEGFADWYVVEVVDESETVQGKPVQLKKDASFSWDFQSGDADAWINMIQPNTKTASITPGYSGEADLTWPENGVYIYELAYFKNHNSPCGEDKPKHDYTISAYLPDFCDDIAAYADSVRVMGGFDGWSDGIWMEKKIDDDFNDFWYAELKDVEEGTEFKLRFGTDNDWAVQVRKDGQNLGNEKTGETTAIVLAFDGEGYDFAACAAPVTYAYTTYENWQLKHEGSGWEWTENLEKVQNGLFKLANAEWTGSGFNVASDENPIKKDWFAPEELTVLDGIIAPATVDVYLKVIDDETVAIGIGTEPTGLEEIQSAKATRRAYMLDGQIYFKSNGKIYNVLGTEMK